uniref:Uncharacterized protein n=1 Tax=Peronospora matthiolae TaxID=2874970 RepID=A0AAV1TJX2_9STRA
MSSSPNESKTLCDYLVVEEAVNYGSDTSVHGDTGTMSDSLMPEAQPSNTPYPFSERGDASAPLAQHSASGSDETIITNPLDEQQQLLVQQEENAQRRVQMVATLKRQRDYVFTPPSMEERLRQAAGQTLATWVIGHEPKTPAEVVSCQALRERYLEPHLTTQSQYKARLDMQARGAQVPPIKGIPILLFAGETVSEEEDAFVHLVHHVRRLSNMFALRASAHAADVRLKRKLRYDYAKLKARGQLRKRTRYASATKVAASAGQSVANNPPTRTTSGEERPRSREDHGHDAQNHPKCKGSLAEGVSQTSMNYQILGTLATLPDTGIGPDDDVVSVVSRHEIDDTHAHRAKSVAAGVPVEAHENVVLEVKGLQETLGKTQCMLAAMQIRLQAMEQAQTRSEAQLDLLIRLQQSGGSAFVVGASASKFTWEGSRYGLSKPT